MRVHSPQKFICCFGTVTDKNIGISKHDKHKMINANGKIDQPFYQGELGDCVLMATLRDIDDNENIEKDLQPISLDQSGNYHVHILNNDIVVSRRDILDAKELGIYSKGDDDVLIIELAYEKYLIFYKTGSA